MRCLYPLKGYKSRTVGPTGKRGITFSVREGYQDLPMEVPCGQCKACRLERSRQWAVRCMHEAALYERNCFITLTIADQHMPKDGSLDKSVFQKFMKRLRKEFPGDKIRYYHCGEYGEKYGRPHYHACLFNFDFLDKYHWTRRGSFPVWRSATLERLWPFGNSEIGTVTFESAAYVARYIMKKVTGPLGEEFYAGKLAPYTTMSRRPGIGRAWYERFKSEVYPSDSVVVRGKLAKPPRYYDRLFGQEDVAGSLELSRRRRAQRRREDETPERLAAMEKVLEARLSQAERRLEE